MDAKDEFTDCFRAKCVLATRADHTLSGDRSQDVKVPVAFVGQDPVDTDDDTTTGGTDGGSTSGTSGGTTSGSGTGGTAATGGTGASATGTASGGSLAATGATVGTVVSLALLLTAVSWYVHRRARTARAG